MKLFLIALVLIFSLASCTVTEVKAAKRAVADEEMALEIHYYGSCREFKQDVLSSVWVNKFSSCQPIQSGVAQNPDADDLHSHYFCTNYDESRSIVHFVEIYDTDENIPYKDFVLSLIPSAPFRVLTGGVSLSRRPNCFTTQDYCNGTNYIVNGCTSNDVTYRTEERHDEDRHNNDYNDNNRNSYDRHGKRNVNEFKHSGPHHDNSRRRFVVNKDRIYITANQKTSDTCRTSTSASACCQYISHESFGGICDRASSQELLSFPKRKHHEQTHHNNNQYGNVEHHEQSHHNNNQYGNVKQQEQPHHNNNQYGNVEHQEQSHHNNNQYGNAEHHEQPQHNQYDNDDHRDNEEQHEEQHEEEHEEHHEQNHHNQYDNDDHRDNDEHREDDSDRHEERPNRPGYNGHVDDDKKRSEESK